MKLRRPAGNPPGRRAPTFETTTVGRHRHPGRSPLRALVAGLAISLLGLVPLSPFGGPSAAPAARAADIAAEPSPDPTATANPTIAPDPTATADPTPAATPNPTPTPAPDPVPATTPAPDPTSDPTAAPVPSTAPPDPSTTPSVDPSPPSSAVPSPSVPPVIVYQLSPGQQRGRRVGPAIPIYKLNATALDPVDTSPHGGAGVSGSDCAACHSAHTARQADLLNAPAAPGGVCYACHAGAGGGPEVADDFSAVPSNSPSTASYFSHPLAAAAEPGDATVACANCHNPHLSDTSRPVGSTSGWTAGGPIAAAAGVAVDNGTAGTAPIYTAITHGTLTYEYQLCLNCHSGAVKGRTPTDDPAHPSWWALDAGIEFNPANASVHPVEAAGRNISAQMAASLAGTSPFKAWNLSVDSTIRCTQCHGDPSTVNQTDTGTPKMPGANVLEASHGSPNRGLLTAPYRDRTLKAASEGYDAADFALCYLCHAERPFKDPNPNPSAADTAFSLHGAHLTQDPYKGSGSAGGSIDTAGAGAGLALCSECHFRSHSTALAYRPGDSKPVADTSGATGLVNFAPNVVPLSSATPMWKAPNDAGSGSCALTCHGYTHDPSATTPTGRYAVAPATGFTASPTSGAVGASGLTVQFTDATRYADPMTDAWSWDFGDGGTSTSREPSHTYAAANTYTVTLTVTRTADGLRTTMARSGYITVTP